MWDSKKKYYIVADRDYFPVLFKLKRDNPDLKVKFLSKEELLDKLSFSYKKDPIPFLLQQGLSYKKAKKWQAILRVADINKNEEAIKYFNLLKDNDYIGYDEYGEHELGLGMLLLFEMDNDKEMISFLNRKGREYSLESFASLGISQRVAIDNPPPILEYKNKFEMYSDNLAKIREELLKPETDPNSIYLHVSEEDLIYLKSLSSIYGLKIFTRDRHSLLTVEPIAKKLDEIYKNKSFSVTYNGKNNDDIGLLKKIIDDYKLEELGKKNFEFAYSCLNDILSSQSYETEKVNEGLIVYTNFIFSPYSKIYVFDFQFGHFSKEFTDNSVLSDSELEKIGANTSYDLSLMDKQKKKNFILYQDIAVLARPLERLTDKLYASNLLEEFIVTPEDKEKDKKAVTWKNYVKKKKYTGDEGILTSKALDTLYAFKCDESFFTSDKHNHEYRSYNHKYSQIKETALPYQEWSVTQIEKFYQCPFAFYLGYLLPSLEDDRHAMWRGTLFHKVFENIFDEDFNFEKSWEVGVAQYKDNFNKYQASLNYPKPFDGKEELLLSLYKKHLSNYIESIRSWTKEQKGVYQGKDAPANYPFDLNKNKSEQNIDLYVELNRIPYQIKGKIDKIFFTKSLDGMKTYYTLIDYKTGAERFDFDNVYVGYALQLPLYLASLSEDKALVGDAIFGGFGIMGIYSSNISKMYKYDDRMKNSPTKPQENARLTGITLCEKGHEYIDSIDINWAPNSKKVYSPKKKENYFVAPEAMFQADGSMKIKSNQEDIEGFSVNKLISSSKTLAAKVLADIAENQFAIRPVVKDNPLKTPKDGKGSKTSCDYCPYKDVCYVDKRTDFQRKYGEKMAFFYPDMEIEESLIEDDENLDDDDLQEDEYD